MFWWHSLDTGTRVPRSVATIEGVLYTHNKLAVAVLKSDGRLGFHCCRFIQFAPKAESIVGIRHHLDWLT